MATEEIIEAKKKEPKSWVKPKDTTEVFYSKQQQVELDSETALPVASIGASAGGLATLEAFFSTMPADDD